MNRQIVSIKAGGYAVSELEPHRVERDLPAELLSLHERRMRKSGRIVTIEQSSNSIMMRPFR